jgi:hypothetical protein
MLALRETWQKPPIRSGKRDIGQSYGIETVVTATVSCAILSHPAIATVSKRVTSQAAIADLFLLSLGKANCRTYRNPDATN